LAIRSLTDKDRIIALTMRRSAAFQSAAMAALLFVSMTVTASPFPTRDQNPLLTGFGVPIPMPSRINPDGEWSFAADFNWGNSAIAQESDREALFVDAETRELRLTLGRTFAERWAVQLQLPYRYTGAGSLDSFIDHWHDFFSLPQGIRPQLPRDQFRIAYERDQVRLIDSRDSSEGIGDMSVATGYQWLSNERSSLAAWLNLKLPTGDADHFTGSGATDVALAIAGEQRLTDRWSLFGQVASTWLGKGDTFGSAQNSVIWSGLAGVGVDVWRGLELKLQLDAHTAALNSDLDYLSSAGILTIGGAWHFKSGWQLDFGVSEDIVVDASPDVVFVVGIRREARAQR